MTRGGDDKTPSSDEGKSPAPHGEKAFAVVGYVINAAKVTVVVIGLMLVVIALSGADMARLDEHEIFRYRLYAAPALIVGYLLVQNLLVRRRATRERGLAKHNAGHNARDEFALSIDPAADRHAAQTAAAAQAKVAQSKRGYGAEFIALAFVAAGGAAFWHDHMTNEIPNPVAVVGKFVSAVCVEPSRRGAGVGVVVGPHMSIGYEFPSQSTSARVAQTKCLLENCEPEKAPPTYTDTEYNRVFYATVQECKAALPAVLASRAPVTIWTGDKHPDAAVRARFTPERANPPYFLLWFPSAVAIVVLLISSLRRRRLAPDR